MLAEAIEEACLRKSRESVDDNVAVVVDGSSVADRVACGSDIGQLSVSIHERMSEVPGDIRFAGDVAVVVYSRRLTVSTAESSEIGHLVVSINERVGREISG